MKVAINENDEVFVKAYGDFARVHRVRSTPSGTTLYGVRFKSSDVHPDELRKRQSNHDHCDAYVTRRDIVQVMI